MLTIADRILMPFLLLDKYFSAIKMGDNDAIDVTEDKAIITIGFSVVFILDLITGFNNKKTKILIKIVRQIRIMLRFHQLLLLLVIIMII